MRHGQSKRFWAFEGRSNAPNPIPMLAKNISSISIENDRARVVISEAI